MSEKYTVTNNTQNMQFKIELPDGEFAHLEYRWYKGNLALMHTFVPKPFEGRGVASALAKHALEYAKENKLQIMVYCPYVAKYLKKHPEYNYLLNKEFHQ